MTTTNATANATMIGNTGWTLDAALDELREIRLHDRLFEDESGRFDLTSEVLSRYGEGGVVELAHEDGEDEIETINGGDTDDGHDITDPAERAYFERFPGIQDYMEETKRFARANGYVTTLFGRRCHYPGIKDQNPSVRGFNERAAINARLQGTAADIIRRAMIRMDEALRSAKVDARMLLQVHDELIFEVAEKDIKKTLPVVTKIMEEAPLPAVALSIPLSVDARAASNWEEAH